MLHPIRPARSLLCAARTAGFRGPELRRKKLPTFQPESMGLLQSAGIANGSVKITSAPGGATVLADGRTLGQTPLGIEGVKPGDVTYELQLAGYKPASVSGSVKPQQQTFLAMRLEKSVGPAPGQPFTNSLGMKFVPLGDIQISVWETRVQDYEAFCRATGRHYEPADFHQTATDPAVKVSWFDAM